MSYRFILRCLVAFLGLASHAAEMAALFREPPDSARPGVYWYFMDGNLSRDGMTRDLESMKTAGVGHLVFLEVNVGVPRGPVDFLSEQWQGLFAHAVKEAERLGIEITLGSGPGWTGSGGPWVKPEQSMQHLVASRVEVEGPALFDGKLVVPPPRRPFFGDVPAQLRGQWEGFFRDVAVLAFPTPSQPATIPDIDEKALVYRAPFSSEPNVKPRLEAPANYPPDVAGSAIVRGKILDLTGRLRRDGTLDWRVPAGKWTILRFVSRNNGASTRPAPDPGIGFECDKFDSAALDAHFTEYVGKLLRRVGPRQRGRGWTMLHIDSWEMGAQNWTPKWREEFKRRRGYDPQPFYPVCAGLIVGSREESERFLWDLRRVGQELVIENHAEHLKRLGRKHGFGLSIEPYDMNPVNDFDLGAVADVPMCEFWSLGFDTAFSCHTAASIAHVRGLPVVAAEAFTAGPQEAWKFFPGSLKNQGDWAFATGINRLTYHTFAHKPDEGRPGMVMGPYGVHWDRGQTWWPMVADYHRYISRCQFMLRQGQTVADVLYLIPEGAPNVFQPPPSAFSGSSQLPDRCGYNFDGCSADALMKLARVRKGSIVFPGGAAYRVLVLPDVETMTPELLRKIKVLVEAGATVIGNPPWKSPSLVNYPECDEQVEALTSELWGGHGPGSVLSPDRGAEPPRAIRRGKGQVIPFVADISRSGRNAQPGGGAIYPHYDFTSEVLRNFGVAEDFVTTGPLRYTHRRAQDRDIYFVANRSNQVVETTGSFRVNMGAPELWDPVHGSIRPLPECSQGAASTVIPLRFEPFESYFIVFPRKAGRALHQKSGEGAGLGQFAEARNFPRFDLIRPLGGPWTVSFDAGMGVPRSIEFKKLEDWSQRPEPALKFYSGRAIYSSNFNVDTAECSSRLYLDLGTVHVIARVRVNGKDCGVLWTAPWRLDISQTVKPGINTLEIEVANLWPNRMIGDAAEPGKKYTQTTYRPYKAGDPLFPSGLLGPVRLLRTGGG